MTSSLGTPVPSVALARHAAKKIMGWMPMKVHRFTVGTAHYVFEVISADQEAAVVRMAETAKRADMRAGAALAARLALLGVPLPEIFGSDFDDPCPYVVMERLPGTDLGQMMARLSLRQLKKIAGQVAVAQRLVSSLGSAGRYGYAVHAEDAPFMSWPLVIEAHVARSRSRIAAAGYFDISIVARLAEIIARWRSPLAAIPATPFLHDTTTKNVIIGPDGSFSGIVDVDDLCFGDPRYPVALTRAVLLGYGGPLSYVSVWMEAGGHAEDGLFELYCAAFLLDLMSEHGQAANGNERPSQKQQRDGLISAFNAIMARLEAMPPG